MIAVGGHSQKIWEYVPKRREMMREIIIGQIQETTAVVALLDELFFSSIERSAVIAVNALRDGGTLYIVGNGGSAADAQHWVGELVGRFLFEREPLRAQALTTNSSILTALVNDYPPEEVFARQVRALLRSKDVLIAISTSGNSGNIIRAIEEAKKCGCRVIGFTGKDGGRIRDMCDALVRVPSGNTPRIQEVHLMAGHALCAAIEREIFGAG